MFGKKKNNRGFTLIEMLVVIAIISLLSSIMFAQISHARAKAQDIKKISEFRQISTALQLYFDTYGFYPNISPYHEVSTNAWSDNFDSVISQLVAENFLGGEISNPNTPGFYDGYNYYNYGPGTEAGALLVTVLETVPDTKWGISPSCRPFTGGMNWCDDIMSKDYCLCHPH